MLRLAQQLRRPATITSRRLLNATVSSELADQEPNFEEDFGDYDVILPPEPYIFGTSHIKPRAVPDDIPKPPYVTGGPDPGAPPYSGNGRIALGGPAEAAIRRAAQLARDVREYAGTLVKPGVTTDAIDAAVHAFIIARRAYPSPLHYQGFPRACCTSVNNVVVHGIPDERPLRDGDIVNVDITVFLGGVHGDTSATFHVGNVDAPGRALIRAAGAALAAGIAACGPGRPFNGIGAAIAARLSGAPFSVSPQFTGHGIGAAFHRPPWILHHRNDEPGLMAPGDCFTIEPAIVQGDNPRAWIFPDGWTASTENCARSAQAEHMVLITDDGVDVLTV